MMLIFSFSELVSGSVESVSEEKARKVLERVDFLSKLREEVVTPVLQKLSRDSIGLGQPLIR